MCDFIGFVNGLRQVNRVATSDRRCDAGLRGGGAVVLRSGARKRSPAFAAFHGCAGRYGRLQRREAVLRETAPASRSRTVPRASAREVPASCVKYPG